MTRLVRAAPELMDFSETSDRRTVDVRRHGGGDRESFRGNSSQKFDFARRSDAVARPGSRELRAVKIPASYDAWRPPKRRKNDSDKNRFFWVSEISFSSFFLDFGKNRHFSASKSFSS